MQRHTPPNSSNIEHVAHDPATKELHVTFKSGGTWVYSGVHPDVFEGMKNAESPGTFLHRNIKGRYGERKI